MAGPQSRGKKSAGNSGAKKIKTKRRTLDMDQIWHELQPEKVDKSKQDRTEFDEDKPGLGQYYCMACSRYFSGQKTLEAHYAQKNHKRRVKELKKEKPYSTEDAYLPIDNGKPLRRGDEMTTEVKTPAMKADEVRKVLEAMTSETTKVPAVVEDNRMSTMTIE
ncbi:hypothetical protein PROFUN_01016 [Planoprotostelium fungivorum]|uniref:C2H2-type domain-containing protein n=1 Tax=Planoprotostelium fungivorum TaxID=1890364 RepID=A0A2P6N4H8_9EUKA|nr:hypothetical protein PROFUN_01016 [Planoprotostelium fungivorum]